MICPRRLEDGAGPGSMFWPADKGDDPDHYLLDGSCSYCGSLKGEELMARIEAGTVELGPTDKGYKVYYRVVQGNPIERKGANKFYLNHLTTKQHQRFIELLNEGKIKFGEPGHFYVLPFFVGIKGYDFVTKKGPKPTVYCLRGDESK